MKMLLPLLTVVGGLCLCLFWGAVITLTTVICITLLG